MFMPIKWLSQFPFRSSGGFIMYQGTSRPGEDLSSWLHAEYNSHAMTRASNLRFPAFASDQVAGTSTLIEYLIDYIRINKG